MISNIPWFFIAQKRKMQRQKRKIKKYSISTATFIFGKCKITDERTPEEKILEPSSVTLVVKTHLEKCGLTTFFPDFELVSKTETEIIYR